MAFTSLCTLVANVLARDPKWCPGKPKGWQQITERSTEYICKSIHRSRFQFPSLATGEKVLRVFKWRGEWSWELSSDGNPYIIVLDPIFTNLAMVYIYIPGNPEPALVGGRRIK